MAGEEDLLKRLNEQFGHEEPSKAGQDEEARPEESESRSERSLQEREVKAVGVFEHPKGTFVLLRDNSGRAMPIWIGPAEGLSISVALEGQTTPRPLAHDLVTTLIERFGVTVDGVLIDDLHNSTYYAKLNLRQDSEVMDIDCRPSDAIAVALRAKAPIYVAEHVLEESQVDWTEE